MRFVRGRTGLARGRVGLARGRVGFARGRAEVKRSGIWYAKNDKISMEL